MSDLFAMTDSAADAKLAAAAVNSVDSLAEIDAPLWRGSIKGPGLGFMRGFAKVADTLGIALGGTAGQAIDATADVGDILDTLQFDASGRMVKKPSPEHTQAQDAIFRAAEEHTGSAIDYWTPRANEVGRVGQVLGGLGEVGAGLVAGLGTPYALVATSTAEGGKELVDQGVDAGTAGAAAALEGGAAYAGLKIPIVGGTLATRLASGAAGNVALGAGSRAAEKALLESQGYEDQAKPFTTDLAAFSTDALTGLLFGGLHHALSPRINPKLTPSQADAVLTARNAKSFQEGTAPGRPDDVRSHVASQQAAADTLERLSRGGRVDVGDIVARHEGASFAPDGKIEESARLAKMVEDNAPDELGKVEHVEVPHADINALKVDEPVRASLRDAYVKAAEVKPAFDRSVRAIADKIGTSHDPLIPPTLKGAARAAEKVIADYGGDASKVKDLVRATVVVDNVAQADAAIKAAIAKFGEPTKQRNTLDTAVETADGYRDVNLNFKVNGHTVELQVNLPEMIAAKLANEGLYHERRTLQAKLAKGDLDAAGEARIVELDSQMKAAYAAAWKDALSRSKTSAEISSPSLRGKLSDTRLPPGTSNAKTATPPSDVRATETGTPSQSKNLGSLSKKDIAESSSGILPEGQAAAKTPGTGLESPHMQALRQLAAERPDATVYSGYDADGQPVKSTIAAEYERIQREYERDIEDTKAYEAAVTCFLGHGG